MDRRNFLKLGGAAGAGLLVPWQAEKALAATTKAAKAAPKPNLTMFTELLTGAPPVYSANAVINGLTSYAIPIGMGYANPHVNLPGGIPIFGYGSTWPSATIEARSGVPFYVQWINNLPPKHILAASIDRGLAPTMPAGMSYMGMDPSWMYLDNRIATHLHGGHVPFESDGGPRAWYTPDWNAGAVYGPDFNTTGQGDVFYYPNNQRAATLWFHDHAMAITRINVYAGMAGFYIIRDALDDGLALPKAPYEIPLVFQDRAFAPDPARPGSYTLFYPPAPEVPEYFGDVMTVNGKVWPRLKVEPRKYRFRLLNGSNARFLRMILTLSDAVGTLPNNPVAATPFVQIGTDGGLMQQPVTVPKILMAPAERCDVVIDFSAFAGKFLLAYNDASTPFGNTNKTAGAIKPVMLFDVSLPLSTVPDPALPTTLDPGIPNITLPYTSPNNPLLREITLDEIVDINGMLRQLLNYRGFETDAQFVMRDDTYRMNNLPPGPGIADWSIKLGSSETWRLVNTTVDVHPIHMHQAMFRIISRQTFDVNRYNKDRAANPLLPLDINLYLMGAARAADANEQGWKDTVRANPGEVVTLEAPFVDYASKYVTHCHILEHEEHDMMLPLHINPPAV